MIKMCEKFGNAFTLHPNNKNITVFIITLVTLREIFGWGREGGSSIRLFERPQRNDLMFAVIHLTSP